jgi:hypothetical protein
MDMTTKDIINTLNRAKDSPILEVIGLEGKMIGMLMGYAAMRLQELNAELDRLMFTDSNQTKATKGE